MLTKDDRAVLTELVLPAWFHSQDDRFAVADGFFLIGAVLSTLLPVLAGQAHWLLFSVLWWPAALHSLSRGAPHGLKRLLFVQLPLWGCAGALIVANIALLAGATMRSVVIVYTLSLVGYLPFSLLYFGVMLLVWKRHLPLKNSN